MSTWPRVTFNQGRETYVIGCCDTCGHVQAYDIERRTGIFRLKNTDRWWARCGTWTGKGKCGGTVQAPALLQDEEAMIAAYQLGGREAAFLVYKASNRRLRAELRRYARNQLRKAGRLVGGSKGR